MNRNCSDLVILEFTGSKWIWKLNLLFLSKLKKMNVHATVMWWCHFRAEISHIITLYCSKHPVKRHAFGLYVHFSTFPVLIRITKLIHVTTVHYQGNTYIQYCIIVPLPVNNYWAHSVWIKAESVPEFFQLWWKWFVSDAQAGNLFTPSISPF